MPNFTYSAIDSQGRTTQGTLTADSRAAALEQVAGQGLSPLSIKDQQGASGEPAGKKLAPGRTPRVSTAQVESFTRELANLLGAGVPLGRALYILKREASNAGAKHIWGAINDDVSGGTPLAEALARWPKSFPPIYIAMVRAGETGGFLDVVLNQIADFRSREGELKGKVKSAMIYPAVLASLAALVMVFLLTFFIPTFTPIFASFGASLPLITKVIIGISNVIASKYGVVVAIFLAVGAVTLRRGLNTDSGRRIFERTLFKLPGIGIITARFSLVRFARMLGTLLGAGVPLVTALRVAQEAIGNQTLSDAVSEAIDQVKRGSPLSRALGACPALFPPSVIEMVAIAEETGRLDKELVRLALNYEGELDRRLRMLAALAEPAMLFIMASLIGTIVVGMLLPIFTLQDLIK